MMISQDYFDETCRENLETFELTEDAAVQETMDQLTASTASLAADTDNNAASQLAHLLVSYPDSSQGQEQRQERASFVRALECVSTSTSNMRLAIAAVAPSVDDNDMNMKELYSALQLVDEKVTESEQETLPAESEAEADAASSAASGTDADADAATTCAATTRLDATYYRHVFLMEQGWTRYWDALQSLVADGSLEVEENNNINNDNDDEPTSLLSTSLVAIMFKTLASLVTALDNSNSSTNNSKLVWQHRRALQQIMPTYMLTWLRLYQEILTETLQQQQPKQLRLQLLHNLLVTALSAVQQCEGNKQLWTRLQPRRELEHQKQRSLLELLLDTVDGIHKHLSTTNAVNVDMDDCKVIQDKKEWHNVARAVGRLLTSLGTFEDSSSSTASLSTTTNTSSAGTVVASAHATVLTLAELGAVHKLLALCKDYHEQLEPAVVSTLRCMAIHDSIVQSMVAGGVLEVVRACFVDTVVDVNANNGNDNLEAAVDKDGKTTIQDDETKEKEGVDHTTAVVNQQWALRSAVIGLVRNICANDEIKCTLCGGRQNVVQGLIQIMNSAMQDKTPGYSNSHALLLEHACGTIAAMALRFSRNAKYLVACGAADAIVRAMYKYPDKVALQRQAALAIRNIVSRSTDLCPALLQAGAQVALTNVAARHVRCQDEVYAALRDLGVPVSMRVAEHDDATGKMVLRQREMFGECKPNFRAVFD
jgi:hypothetical protein